MDDARATPEFDADATVTPSEHQVSTSLEGEVVLLDTASGRYFTLDGVGAWVWTRIVADPPPAISDLESAIRDRYDVPPERCRADLNALVEELRRAGLVVVHQARGR